ncbi:MAG: hypothetical protein AAGF93_00040 [Cyanobacteria bacterium P01_H01_bin.105]
MTFEKNQTAAKLYEEALTLVEKARGLRLKLHENGLQQIELQKRIALIRLKYQDQVNNDKGLSNEPKRKTALTSLLNTDKSYTECETAVEKLQSEAALVSIEIRYTEDLLKLSHAALSAGFTGES